MSPNHRALGTWQLMTGGGSAHPSSPFTDKEAEAQVYQGRSFGIYALACMVFVRILRKEGGEGGQET